MSTDEGQASLETRLRQLEARLRSVEDAQAIQNLKSRYGELADARYGRDGVRDRQTVEGLARQISELFTEDAVWDAGGALGSCCGRQAIYERFCEPTLRFSWHYFVKPKIEVSGDRATGTWDILAPCTTQDGRAMWMSGWEEDAYRRDGGRWLHERMKLHLVFMAPHDVGWARSRPE